MLSWNVQNFFVFGSVSLKYSEDEFHRIPNSIKLYLVGPGQRKQLVFRIDMGLAFEESMFSARSQIDIITTARAKEVAISIMKRKGGEIYVLVNIKRPEFFAVVLLLKAIRPWINMGNRNNSHWSLDQYGH